MQFFLSETGLRLCDLITILNIDVNRTSWPMNDVPIATIVFSIPQDLPIHFPPNNFQLVYMNHPYPFHCIG